MTRTIRLDRQGARIAIGLAVLYGAFLVTGLALVIPGVQSVLDRRDYESLIAERSAQGERLETLVRGIETVGREAQALSLALRRIAVTYDLAPPSRPEDAVGAVAGEPAASIYSTLIEGGHAATTAAGVALTGARGALEAIEEHEATEPAAARQTPSISPLGPATWVLTASFGPRRNPFTEQMELHSGIDLAALTGTPIVAPADGAVAFAGRYQLRQGVAWWRFGTLVALRHAGGIVSLYGHCDEIRVRRGQRIARGQVIATVGNTGWSTNPHLHYEVRRRDADGHYRPVDPRILMLDESWTDLEQIVLAASQGTGERTFETLPRSLR